jgi:hypothetical protein
LGQPTRERKREAGTLAALKAERASVAAKGRQIETEAAPIRYVAELVGADTDSERAIRWLIALTPSKVEGRGTRHIPERHDPKQSHGVTAGTRSPPR